jgi:hypothetical protein
MELRSSIADMLHPLPCCCCNMRRPHTESSVPVPLRCSRIASTMTSCRMLLHTSDGDVKPLHLTMAEMAHLKLEGLLHTAHQFDVLEQQTGALGGRGAELEYKDEEGEWCTLTSDRHVQDMVRMVVKLANMELNRRAVAAADRKSQPRQRAQKRSSSWFQQSTESLDIVSSEDETVEMHDVLTELHIRVQLPPVRRRNMHSRDSSRRGGRCVIRMR